MNITTDIKLNPDYCMNEIVELLKEECWNEYLENIDNLEIAFANSFNVSMIMKEEEPIGFIRLLGDGIHTILIQDLLIKKDKRNNGYGSLVLKEIITKYRAVRQIFLLCDMNEELMRFYSNNGMRKVNEYRIECFGIF